MKIEVGDWVSSAYSPRLNPFLVGQVVSLSEVTAVIHLEAKLGTGRSIIREHQLKYLTLLCPECRKQMVSTERNAKRAMCLECKNKGDE